MASSLFLQVWLALPVPGPKLLTCERTPATQQAAWLPVHTRVVPRATYNTGSAGSCHQTTTTAMCALHHACYSGAAAAAGGVLADIAGLQQPDGAFAGDKWGEIDTR